MRPLLTAFALIAALALPLRQAHAHDAYSDAESNPLKIASYPVAAAGFVLEWLVTRPVHFLVSQPTLQNVFNYEPAYNAFDTPQPYLPSRQGTVPEDASGAQVVLPDDGGQ